MEDKINELIQGLIELIKTQDILQTLNVTSMDSNSFNDRGEEYKKLLLKNVKENCYNTLDTLNEFIKENKIKTPVIKKKNVVLGEFYRTEKDREILTGIKKALKRKEPLYGTYEEKGDKNALYNIKGYKKINTYNIDIIFTNIQIVGAFTVTADVTIGKYNTSTSELLKLLSKRTFLIKYVPRIVYNKKLKKNEFITFDWNIIKKGDERNA